MDFIKWDQCFEIGIDEIDADHRRIVAIVNLMHDELVAKQDIDSGCRALSQLIEAVEEHFIRELELMTVRVPGFARTHAIHYESVIAELRSSLARLQRGEFALTEDILLIQIRELFLLTLRNFCCRLKTA